MRSDRIDFISAYCDSWCERCAFTSRCSHYAVKVAEVMCDGDIRAALELAVGKPQPVNEERGQTIGQERFEELQGLRPSERELAEYRKVQGARAARLAAHPLTGMARTYSLRATAWLNEYRERFEAAGDPVLGEALQVIGWDACLIGAKIHRALSGRDESVHGEMGEDHPVQNDWNGSAKVALLSLARSAAAWRAVAQATGDTAASTLADGVAYLHRSTEAEFPKATSFVRPGFDEIPLTD